MSPSLFAHTFRLAEALVATLCACHARRIEIVRFIRENELTFTAGNAHVQPDGFFRLLAEGRYFNLAFEIDNSTASVDSPAANSILQKLTTYDAYQELVLSVWRRGDKRGEKPRIRVVFGQPVKPGAAMGDVRAEIHKLGDWVRHNDDTAAADEAH